MLDAPSTRRTPRRWSALGALSFAGFFGLFKKGEPAAAAPARVRVVPANTSPTAPPAPVVERAPGTLNDVLFKGLHGDTDPAANVRTSEMTCSSCDRKFRYFINSNGAKTTARCPGCARQFRV